MIDITIASDYVGVDLKEKLLNDSELSKEIRFIDIGIERGSLLDYVDISKKLADSLLFNSDSLGIIICESGHGVAIALNRFTHIRATTCNNIIDAATTREKLNANVLCVGSKCLDLESAKNVIRAFIKTKFLSEKHGICVAKLHTNQTTHHKHGVNLIVRAIITHQDHILLTTTTDDNKNFAPNLFFLPGGHVEYNERALSALKREIWEEMNLEFYDEKFVGALECAWNREGSIYHEINIVYKIQIDHMNLEAPPIAVDHKFHKFVWKSLAELEGLPLLPVALKQIIYNM
jgi:RpiB/LacA/LacB family sugar-phosphate isomerase